MASALSFPALKGGVDSHSDQRIKYDSVQYHEP